MSLMYYGPADIKFFLASAALMKSVPVLHYPKFLLLGTQMFQTLLISQENSLWTWAMCKDASSRGIN